MLMPKKHIIQIYSYLFKEGVMCCKKDMSITKNLGADGEGKEVVIPNLHCVKLCQSLKSRGYVREQFNWQWYYFFLTDEGIDFLRSYLHLPSEIVPATLKKQARAARPPTAYQGERRERPERRFGDKNVGPGGDFAPEFRREGGRDFGREGGREGGRDFGREGGRGGFRGGRGRGFGRGGATAGAQ